MNTRSVTVEDRRRVPQRASLIYPEYGPVEAALGFGLFYLLVSIATEPLVAGWTTLLGVDPGAIRTGLAASLWVILGLTVLSQLTRQLQANPHRFTDAAERRRYLRQHRPAPRHYFGALLATGIGGILVWAVHRGFLIAFGSLMTAFATLAVGPVLRIGTILWIVAFFVGFGLFTYGVDRLAVGFVRDLIAASVIGGDREEPPA